MGGLAAFEALIFTGVEGYNDHCTKILRTKKLITVYKKAIILRASPTHTFARALTHTNTNRSTHLIYNITCSTLATCLNFLSSLAYTCTRSFARNSLR